MQTVLSQTVWLSTLGSRPLGDMGLMLAPSYASAADPRRPSPHTHTHPASLPIDLQLTGFLGIYHEHPSAWGEVAVRHQSHDQCLFRWLCRVRTVSMCLGAQRQQAQLRYRPGSTLVEPRIVAPGSQGWTPGVQQHDVATVWAWGFGGVRRHSGLRPHLAQGPHRLGPDLTW